MRRAYPTFVDRVKNEFLCLLLHRHVEAGDVASGESVDTLQIFGPAQLIAGVVADGCIAGAEIANAKRKDAPQVDTDAKE